NEPSLGFHQGNVAIGPFEGEVRFFGWNARAVPGGNNPRSSHRFGVVDIGPTQCPCIKSRDMVPEHVIPMVHQEAIDRSPTSAGKISPCRVDSRKNPLVTDTKVWWQPIEKPPKLSSCEKSSIYSFGRGKATGELSFLCGVVEIPSVEVQLTLEIPIGAIRIG